MLKIKLRLSRHRVAHIALIASIARTVWQIEGLEAAVVVVVVWRKGERSTYTC